VAGARVAGAGAVVGCGSVKPDERILASRLNAMITRTKRLQTRLEDRRAAGRVWVVGAEVRPVDVDLAVGEDGALDAVGEVGPRDVQPGGAEVWPRVRCRPPWLDRVFGRTWPVSSFGRPIPSLSYGSGPTFTG